MFPNNFFYALLDLKHKLLRSHSGSNMPSSYPLISLISDQPSNHHSVCPAMFCRAATNSLCGQPLYCVPVSCSTTHSCFYSSLTGSLWVTSLFSFGCPLDGSFSNVAWVPLEHMIDPFPAFLLLLATCRECRKLWK